MCSSYGMENIYANRILLCNLWKSSMQIACYIAVSGNHRCKYATSRLVETSMFIACCIVLSGKHLRKSHLTLYIMEAFMQIACYIGVSRR